eukprot:10889876-Ditylum_brightwellii.AAC.1
MLYARGQQAMVQIDQNNPSAWDFSPTSNWQWTPAKPPTFTSSWQTAKTFNVVDFKAIKADEDAGIGL